MKLSRILIGLGAYCLILSAMAGCERRIVTESQVRQVGDLVYDIRRNRPFTGMVIDNSANGWRYDIAENPRRLDSPSFVISYKNGLKDGLSQYWYPDGVLKEELRYVKGALQGRQTHYYPNGRLMSQFSCLNGERSGRERVWDEDGKRIF